jgi:hypothetical protein
MAKAPEIPRPALRSRCGDALIKRGELRIEVRIVHAKLEELSVGKLQDILDIAIVLTRLDDERIVPRQNGEIIVIIRKAMRKELLARGVGQWTVLTE